MGSAAQGERYEGKSVSPDDPGQPPEPDPALWPAWLVDAAIATAVAGALAASLSFITFGWLPRILAWTRQRRTDGLGAPVAAAVRNRLRSEHRLARDLTLVIGEVLRREAYPQGWLAGQRSARAKLAGPIGTALVVDWSGWEPGDAAAARRLVEGDGLRGLLAASDVAIEGIADTKLDEVARTIADGLSRGLTPQGMARELRECLEDESSALRIAWTETSRAISAAALDEYAAAGVATKDWLSAEDARVCPVCRGNAEIGFIPLGAPFPSGVLHPPGHPRCRCAPGPGPVAEPDDGA